MITLVVRSTAVDWKGWDSHYRRWMPCWIKQVETVA